MSITQNTQTEQYAVIAFTDLFGTGYRVQKSEYVADAIADGWDVIVNNRTNDEAEHIARIYRTAGKVETATPDLSDLLTYDFTQPVELRDNSVAEEFDLVSTPIDAECSMWLEGTITAFDEDYVELDGFILVDRNVFLKHATLIAKADDDSGFVTEYADYCETLNKNMETIYEIASQTAARYGNVA